MGWVVAVAAALGLTGVLWLILRPRGGISTRLGPDGFFVRGVFEPGAQIRYQVRVNGSWRSGVAEVVGAETFVYTGATPTEVRILEVAGGAPVSVPPSSGPSLPSTSSDDDSFGGFPSAY